MTPVPDTLEAPEGSGVDAVSPAPELPAEPTWQTARNGKLFLSNAAGGWPIWRKGDETPEQALARAAKGKADKPPKSKTKRAAAGKASETVDPVSRDKTTRAIQEMCAGILTAPAVGCAMFGDEWGANHFQVQGERFAANLARSSEHNPWLRGKLEKGLEGETTIMAVLTSVSLTAGAVGYLAPPAIKWLGLPVPDHARAMLGVPIASPPMPAAGRPAPAPQAAPNPRGYPEPEPGAVPITDALSDPVALGSLAQAFGMPVDQGAADAAKIEADGARPDTRFSEPS